MAFESAHRDDFRSELVVDADHVSVHAHPRSILEVRRILLEHLTQAQVPSSNPVLSAAYPPAGQARPAYPPAGYPPATHMPAQQVVYPTAPPPGHSQPGPAAVR